MMTYLAPKLVLK